MFGIHALHLKCNYKVLICYWYVRASSLLWGERKEEVNQYQGLDQNVTAEGKIADLVAR